MRPKLKVLKRIAIFASGSGTNAENIAKYFADNKAVELSVICCNKPGAGVIERANKLGVQVEIFTKEQFYSTHEVTATLQKLNIDLVVLAGFLWLVPESLLKAFPDRIINIHPSLLPKYGGKGMYGSKVHEAVVASGDSESGITIHLVNEYYDEGQILHQEKVAVLEDDSPDTLANKIHQLEYECYPKVIESYLNRMS